MRTQIEHMLTGGYNSGTVWMCKCHFSNWTHVLNPAFQFCLFELAQRFPNFGHTHTHTHTHTHQLILTYIWARPAILVAGKGRGGMFLFLLFLHFIHFPLSSLSLYFISSTISSVSFLPFSGRQHKMTHKGWHVIKPQQN